MSQYYDDLSYGDKRFVINNDYLHTFNTDVCEELRIDGGVFNEIVSRDYIAIWEILLLA